MPKKKEPTERMVRDNFHIAPEMLEACNELAKEKGYDRAEIYRLAISEYLHKGGKELPIKIPKSLQEVGMIYQIIHDQLPEDKSVKKLELDWETQLAVLFTHWGAAKNAITRACSILRQSGTEVYFDPQYREIPIENTSRTRVEKVGFKIIFNNGIKRCTFHQRMNTAMKNAIKKTAVFAKFALNNNNSDNK